MPSSALTSQVTVRSSSARLKVWPASGAVISNFSGSVTVVEGAPSSTSRTKATPKLVSTSSTFQSAMYSR